MRRAGILLAPLTLACAAGPEESSLKAEEVSFRSGGISLSGTLHLPAGKGPHPAAIAVHGSGPALRTDFGLAGALAGRGIATLAYDKRGVGRSEGDWTRASLDDLAQDALAALAYLRSRPDIDGARIGMIGHSQGGWILQIAASRSEDVSFLVSLAGCAVPVVEQNLVQKRNALRGRIPPGEIEEAIRLEEAAARAIREWADADWDALIRDCAAILEKGKPPRGLEAVVSPQSLAMLKDPEARRKALWHAHRTYGYDPLPAIRAIRCPVLLAFGGKDEVIDSTRNAALWEKALKEGKCRDFAVAVFPDAGHDFRGPGGARAEGLDERVCGWIADRAKPAGK